MRNTRPRPAAHATRRDRARSGVRKRRHPTRGPAGDARAGAGRRSSALGGRRSRDAPGHQGGRPPLRDRVHPPLLRRQRAHGAALAARRALAVPPGLRARAGGVGDPRAASRLLPDARHLGSGGQRDAVPRVRLEGVEARPRGVGRRAAPGAVHARGAARGGAAGVRAARVLAQGVHGAAQGHFDGDGESRSGLRRGPGRSVPCAAARRSRVIGSRNRAPTPRGSTAADSSRP